MLTKEEQHQLHLFCEKDEHLADLIKKMEASHRMSLSVFPMKYAIQLH